MKPRARTAKWMIAACWLAGCSPAEQTAAPPPLPVVVPALPAEKALPEGAETPAPARAVHKPEKARAPEKAHTQAAAQPMSKPAAAESKAARAADRVPSKPAAVTPSPVPASPVTPTPVAPAPVVSAKRVVVPRTANVHVELTAGLQSDLDADPRMQKWVDRVVSIADGCHAKNRAAHGAVEALITMHENERPSADLRPVPGQLGALVTCATFALMQVKMPLFTGREGTRYSVRVVFDPS